MFAKYFEKLRENAFFLMSLADGRDEVEPRKFSGLLALAVYRLTFWLVFTVGLLVSIIVSPVALLWIVAAKRLESRKNGG